MQLNQILFDTKDTNNHTSQTDNCKYIQIA